MKKKKLHIAMHILLFRSFSSGTIVSCAYTWFSIEEKHESMQNIITSPSLLYMYKKAENKVKFLHAIYIVIGTFFTITATTIPSNKKIVQCMGEQ